LVNYSPEPESYFPNCVGWGKGKHSQQKIFINYLNNIDIINLYFVGGI
jgi:hypothetical protein